MMTDPSLRWRLTSSNLETRYVQIDGAHGFSPFYVLVRYFTPASATDWQHSVLVVNVDFDVAVGAFAVPRILT